MLQLHTRTSAEMGLQMSVCLDSTRTVEWRGRVYVTVSYKNISRDGWSDECAFGFNDKSWLLVCYTKSYTFYHNKIKTPVPGPVSSRVGVYLDHRAGIPSF
ncbi:hypothetical protein GOODEAATRI_033955 [Goodea atripinnis]|uniref:Uncharacterized protein n=1 Tax=Goodea atripinnis TaxID=208336 RepID=A0ABV0NFZ0_9TELE